VFVVGLSIPHSLSTFTGATVVANAAIYRLIRRHSLDIDWGYADAGHWRKRWFIKSVTYDYRLLKADKRSDLLAVFENEKLPQLLYSMAWELRWEETKREARAAVVAAIDGKKGVIVL
jgi:hypothetical protein